MRTIRSLIVLVAIFPFIAQAEKIGLLVGLNKDFQYLQSWVGLDNKLVRSAQTPTNFSIDAAVRDALTELDEYSGLQVIDAGSISIDGFPPGIPAEDTSYDAGNRVQRTIPANTAVAAQGGIIANALGNALGNAIVMQLIRRDNKEAIDKSFQYNNSAFTDFNSTFYKSLTEHPSIRELDKLILMLPAVSSQYLSPAGYTAVTGYGLITHPARQELYWAHKHCMINVKQLKLSQCEDVMESQEIEFGATPSATDKRVAMEYIQLDLKGDGLRNIEGLINKSAEDGYLGAISTAYESALESAGMSSNAIAARSSYLNRILRPAIQEPDSDTVNDRLNAKLKELVIAAVSSGIDEVDSSDGLDEE